MENLLICLQNESNAMAALVETLVQEQAALTLAPTVALMEEINTITRNKNEIITTVSQAGVQRRRELARLGFNQIETTLPDWLQDEAQLSCWQQLISHTKKANELNRINGLLINRHLLRNQSTLAVLTKQHSAGSAPSLYGANGQSNAQRSQGRGFVA